MKNNKMNIASYLRSFSFGAALLLGVSMVTNTACVEGKEPSETVSLSDFSAVPESAMASLTELHHELTLAETRIEVAQNHSSDAQLARERLEAKLKGMKADLKAAKAEVKAARINQDDERLDKAEQLVATCEQNLVDADARLTSLRKQKKVEQAMVKRAEAYLSVKQAELELARLQLMIDEGIATASSYNVDAFAAQLQNARDSLAKADLKLDEATRIASVVPRS